MFATPAFANDRTVNLEADALKHFQDCSTGFWYDRERGLLTGRAAKLPVPKTAVTGLKDRYVRIAVTGKLNGYAIQWLLVPGFELGSRTWEQNVLVVTGKVEDVRDTLARAWGLRFVRGAPEGPDVDPDGVAYYSDPPKGRPMLEAASASTKVTSISCPVRARSHTAFETAAAALSRRLTADQAYEPWSRRLRCVSLMSEGETAAHVDIVIRERHTAECGGDPASAPVVDRFRVQRNSGEILWLNLEGAYEPYAAFLRSRAALGRR